MRLSGSYFRKMDNFTKWILGTNRGKNNDESQKENENKKDTNVKGYASFRNEGNAENITATKISSELSDRKQAKTERGHRPDAEITEIQSARYIKKTSRGDQSNKNAGKESCTICLDSAANAVLMDCGHGAICFECGLALLNSTCECHLCRQPVIQVLKIDTTFIHQDLLKVLEAADLHNVVKYNKERETLHTSNV